MIYQSENDLADALDAALTRYKNNEPVTVALTDDLADATEIRQLLATTAVFQPLETVAMPSATALAADRESFLMQAAHYQSLVPIHQPAPGLIQRWQNALVSFWDGLALGALFQKKEAKPMLNLAMRLTIIITILAGSIGGTAVAASNSLPDSPIYELKLVLEDARLALNNNAVSEAELHVQMAAVRISELEQMAQQNQTADNALLTRLQLHLNSALALAATMPESDMVHFLVRTRDRIQSQTRTLQQARANAAEPVQAMLGTAQQLMHQFGQEVEAGLDAPATFRHRHTPNRPDTAPEQPAINPPGPGGVMTPTQGAGPGPCVGDGCGSPGTPQQQGPPDAAPRPGPNANPNQYGTTDEGAPLRRQNGADITPLGTPQQNQYGPGPDQPGPGRDDNSGAGEQNQNAPGPSGSESRQSGAGDAACNEPACGAATTLPDNPPPATPPTAVGKDAHNRQQKGTSR